MESSTSIRWKVLVQPPKCFKNRHQYLLCQCSCGTIRPVRTDQLKNGGSKSCGCLQRQMATKHGYAHSAEYNSWRGMKKRCYQPTHDSYQYYGARGITVCDEWRNSFAQFIKDMGPKPGKNYSIDRIDNDGNYTVTNCKWSDQSEQINNRRSWKWSKKR